MGKLASQAGLPASPDRATISVLPRRRRHCWLQAFDARSISHARDGDRYDAQARPLLARALSEGGNFDELLDPRLENKVDRLELEHMCAAAAAAVRHSAKRRPKMKQVSCSLSFWSSSS